MDFDVPKNILCNISYVKIEYKSGIRLESTIERLSITDSHDAKLCCLYRSEIDDLRRRTAFKSPDFCNSRTCCRRRPMVRLVSIV